MHSVMAYPFDFRFIVGCAISILFVVVRGILMFSRETTTDRKIDFFLFFFFVQVIK
jgi:hypothetical protein